MKIRWMVFLMVLLTVILAACSTGGGGVNVTTPEATLEAEAPDVVTEAAVETEAAATEAPAMTEAVVTEAVVTEAVVTEAPAATEAGALPGTGAVVCTNGVDQTALMSAGEEVYSTRCAACHGPLGEGVGNFPALANNASLTAEDLTEVAGKFFNPEVHPFLTQLNSQDIASVFSFARGSFGNQAEAVCPELIDQLVP